MSENKIVISDDAVEAGAEISFQLHGDKYYSPSGAWAALEPRFRTAWLEDARQILEVAAPYMLAEFEKRRKYEALAAISELGSDDPAENPFRSQA